MNSDRADQPATPENPPQRGVPGQALAAQREAMGWSVEQVADQLKMAVRQVVALEAGDYAALPSPAVTRGFVRAYAKILRLDPAPLVAMIEMDTPAPAENVNRARSLDKPARFNESSRFPLHGKRSSLPVGWIAAGVAVAVAAAAAWHFGLVPHRKAEPAVSSTIELPASAPHGVTEQPLQKPEVPLISVPGQQEQQAPNNAQPPANGAAPAAQPPAAGTPGA
ncbi:helix-turn-helix domain-containing protein, partial [Massilia terrae]